MLQTYCRFLHEYPPVEPQPAGSSTAAGGVATNAPPGAVARGEEENEQVAGDRAGAAHPDTTSNEDTWPSVPFSMSYVWHTIERGAQMLIFALTMGLAAVAMSTTLWMVSTPWIAWRILRWMCPPVNFV